MNRQEAGKAIEQMSRSTSFSDPVVLAKVVKFLFDVLDAREMLDNEPLKPIDYGPAVTK